MSESPELEIENPKPDADSRGAAPGKGGPLISAEELNRRRRKYYWVLFLQFPLAFIVLPMLFSRSLGLTLIGNLLVVVYDIIFLWMFLKTARLAGLSVRALVPIGILMVIPILNIITLMAVDFHIGDTVDRGSGEPVEPRLSRMSYWSLFTCWLPVIGLPLAIISFYQIRKSRGLLTGLGFAITGLALNLIFTVLITMLVIAIINKPASGV
jgi:hypothetical protein